MSQYESNNRNNAKNPLRYKKQRKEYYAKHREDEKRKQLERYDIISKGGNKYLKKCKGVLPYRYEKTFVNFISSKGGDTD